MSVLSKLWKSEVVPNPGYDPGSAGRDGYWAYESTVVPRKTPTVAKPDVPAVVQVSTGFTKDPVKHGPGYIKYATWEEIIKLPDMHFVGGTWWNSATQDEKNSRTTEVISGIIDDEVESGIFGRPLVRWSGYQYIGSTGNLYRANAYLAVWKMSWGIGIFTFYGYTSSTEPTMEITVSNGVVS